MQSLTSREAAEALGVPVYQFHRLVRDHDLSPTYALPGVRGAKFWNPADITRLARELAERPAS